MEVINGRYYCNQNRTTELSNRMVDEISQINICRCFLVIDLIQTRQVHMSMLDCGRPSNVGVVFFLFIMT